MIEKERKIERDNFKESVCMGECMGICVLEKGKSQAERDILSKCLWVRDRVLVCVI